MLTSFERKDWKDPDDIDQVIENLRHGTPSATELRRWFPFKGIARKRLTPYGVPEGAILQYVRLKHEPCLYPIVGIIGVGGDTQWGNFGRKLILNSDEVQVVEA